MNIYKIAVRKEKRALEGAKEGRKLAVIYVCFVFLTIFFLGGNLAGIFTDEAEVILAASGYLKIACFMYFLYALVYPYQGFLNGSGSSGFVLIKFMSIIAKTSLLYILHFLEKIVKQFDINL